jgi:hypothetical protein
MTAAPRAQTDDSATDAGAADKAEADAGWALLDALRRKLDDQAGQQRKLSAQVVELADSIGALVAEQRKRSRWLNLNSFVAYLMFTVLCAGAFYFMYQSRAREVIGARDRAAAERDTAGKRADEADAKLAARDAADAKAWDTFEQLEAGKRDAAGKAMGELAYAPLGKLEREVLAERAKHADSLQVEAALKGAAVSYKAARFAEVSALLTPALALDHGGTHAAELHYWIGMAHEKAGETAPAVEHLEAAVTGDVAQDDARYWLATALDKAGQWGKARAEYDRYATAHPQAGLAVYAQRRSATLARMPAVAPAGAAGTPPAAR